MAGPSKVISREQYLALSAEEKKNWVAYTPTSDPQIKKSISMAEAEAQAAKIMQPIHDKLAALPIENLPAEKLKEIVKKFDPLISAKKAIQKLLSTPIIGTLVAPLVDFINSLIEIIGGIFYLLFVIARGQELFLDGVHNAITQVKWDELEDVMRELKRKKQEAEKQKEAKDKNKKIEKENAEKVKKMLDAKTQQEMDEFEERVKKAYENIEIAEAAAEVQRKLDAALYTTMTWNGMKSALVSAFEILGVDLSPLDQVTPEQAKKFENSFPNPQSDIDKMNKAIDNMNKNTKYIPLSELEKIDAEMAESVKTSRAEREAEIEKSKAEYKARQTVAKARQKEIEDAEKARIQSKKDLEEWRKQRDEKIKNGDTKTNTV